MTINVKPISLMVVASIPEGKAAIQNFLSELKNVDIVGLAYNKRTAIQQLKSIQPDVLLIDVMLLRLHSIDIISYVFSIQSDVKILALSPGDPPHDRIILAVQAGALGYVSWDATPAEISAAIQKVFHGEYYLPLEATYEILQEVAPELKIFAEERRTKIFETLLGLIPLFGVLSAITVFLWREYWEQVGVRAMDLGAVATMRATDFAIVFFMILGIVGPLLFINTWMRMIGNWLNVQSRAMKIITKGQKIKIGKLSIGKLLFGHWTERLIIVVVVLITTLPLNLTGGKMISLFIGVVMALVFLAHIIGIKDELPTFLKMIDNEVKPNLLLLAGLSLIFVFVVGIEVYVIGPDLRTDGLHGFLAPEVLGFSAQPAMLYDVGGKYQPLGVLYLGGNGDRNVLYDPCTKTVRFFPVSSSSVELIEEVQCSSP